MLVRLRNAPRDYAWGSTTLLAGLEGREPSGAPEAEVWFGDHPGAPALVEDGTGRTLDVWLPDVGGATPPQLPYLLKLLAAGSPLSIQAHPTIEQARLGFAREEAAGIPRDAAHRSYRDDNHKPEIIVALSDPFLALSGLREVPTSLELLSAWGEEAEPLRERLRASEDQAEALRGTIEWLLEGEAAATVEAMIGALPGIRAKGFDAEIDAIGAVAAAYPGDPGVLVALLMNLVVLRPGEASFVPAGVPHAYLSGLGVELMSASDNVLRGGLTPKHIDVEELLAVLDTRPQPAQVLRPVPADADGAIGTYDTPVPDFRLRRVRVRGEVSVPLAGTTIAVATEGAPAVAGLVLAPGQAVLATVDESPLRVHGFGELFLAEPGR